MTTRRRERDPSPEDGFVIIPVILVVGLLGFIALVLSKSEALDVNVNAHMLRQAEAEAWANGIVQLTAYQLAASGGAAKEGQPLRTDGTPLTCRIGKGIATVEVFDTAGLIDINFAPQNVLERLFTSLDLAREDAAQLAANIIDFRSVDDIGEVKKAKYLESGRTYGPKNSPFATTGELEQVLGMTPELFLRIQPYVTTESRMPNIDPAVASKQMLAMQLPDAFGMPKAVIRTFIIRAAVRNRGQTRFVREAAVELSPRAPTGFLLREWNRLDTYEVSNPQVNFEETSACLDLLLGGR